MAKTSIENDDNLVKATVLLWSEGESAEEIGKILREIDPENRQFSGSTISKLLKFARTLDLLDDRPRHHLPADEVARLKRFLSPFRFPSRLGIPWEQVFIYSSGRKTSRDEDALPDFTSQLGNQFRRLLIGESPEPDFYSGQCRPRNKASCIGVTWGRTLKWTVSALESLQRKNRRELPEACFLPTCGEAIGAGSRNRDLSSSAIAEKLSELFRAPEPEWTLHAVPAIIPERLPPKEYDETWVQITRHEQNTIRRFISSARPYRAIFLGRDGNPPLIDSVDTLITSVCTEDNPISITNDEYVRSTGIPPEEFRAAVMGDMGGVLFPKDEKTRSLKRFQALWAGIQLRHFEHVYRNANKHNTPGVVVIARGAAKARMVHHVLSKRVVNHLFIDSELADELESLCG